METISLGISGHRTIYNLEEVKSALTKSLTALKEQNPNSQFVVYSGLAVGADILFTDLAIRLLNAKLHMVLPFDEATYQKDFSPSELTEYHRLANQNLTKTIVTTQIPVLDEKKDDAYYAAGERIVGSVDIMFFCWDNEPADGRGGTGDIVELAKTRKRADEKFEFQKIKTIRTELQQVYKVEDAKAVELKEQYLKLWRLGVILSTTAALFFAINVSFLDEKQIGLKTILSGFELILVCIVFFIAWRIRTTRIKERTLSARRSAEKLRILDRLGRANHLVPGIHNTNHNELSTEAQTAIRNELARLGGGLTTNTQKSQSTLVVLVKSQIKYHEERSNKVHPLHHGTEKFHKRLKYVFLPVVVWNLALEISHLIHFHLFEVENKMWIQLGEGLPVFLGMFIPTLYAAAEAWAYFHEWAKQEIQSKVMLEFFDSILSQLGAPKQMPELTEIAQKIFDMMDHENKVWKMEQEVKGGPGI